MIGAVHLAVTVQAVLAQDVLVGGAARYAAAVISLARVEVGRVTLLAQEGAAGGQQAGLHRTVRVVAVAAILDDRLVFPQVGPALLLVALVAVVVQGGRGQHRFGAGAVGVVAIVTAGAALGDGVARGQFQFCAHAAVAIQALGLRRAGIQRQVIGLVGIVAVGAGKVFLLVGTTGPE